MKDRHSKSQVISLQSLVDSLKLLVPESQDATEQSVLRQQSQKYQNNLNPSKFNDNRNTSHICDRKVDLYNPEKLFSLFPPRPLTTLYNNTRPKTIWPAEVNGPASCQVHLNDGRTFVIENYSEIEKVPIATKEKAEKHFSPINVFNCHDPIRNLEPETLLFSCNFESGNLKSATQIGRFSYSLKIREDYNTCGHTQWYFFRIENIIPGIIYDFAITNMMKNNSLYKNGLKPLLHSKNSWHRAGERISYVKNQEKDDRTGLSLFTLQFSISFSSTSVYLAHSYPYTYQNLQDFIYNLKQIKGIKDYFRHRVLGQSVAGNNIDMICVTDKVESPEELEPRPVIIITARVHPGETNSSFIMKGIITHLLGESPEAQYLRKNFVFKLVPCINPDGVIIGNHRCNLRGFDLNRQWRIDPNIVSPEQLSNLPEIYHVKKMILNTSSSREIVLGCDLHGHSRKHGIFLYGCSNDNNDNDKEKNKEKVFPTILDEISSIFEYEKCHFRMHPKKEGTLRVVMKKELNIIDSFTVEASFAGSEKTRTHFTTFDYENMGVSLIQAIEKHVRGRNDINFRIYNHDQTDSEDDSTSDDEMLRKKKKKIPSLSKRYSRPSSASSSSSSRLYIRESKTCSSAYGGGISKLQIETPTKRSISSQTLKFGPKETQKHIGPETLRIQTYQPFHAKKKQEENAKQPIKPNSLIQRWCSTKTISSNNSSRPSSSILVPKANPSSGGWRLKTSAKSSTIKMEKYISVPKVTSCTEDNLFI